MKSPALEVSDLRVSIETQRGIVHPVCGVNFRLESHEILGIVGESGSGKSLTAAAIMGFLPKGGTASGEVRLGTENLLSLSRVELRARSGRDIAMILQDPMTALNPLMRIGTQISEPLRQHLGMTRRAAKARAAEILTDLRVPNAQKRMRDYPHQFSGGMRQRVAGAMAISCNPQVLIADEPTTALDVTVAASYVDLLKRIRDQSGMAIIFISHDIGLVSRLCDRVAVMYAGSIVEMAPTETLIAKPEHPYTVALLECMPDLTRDVSRLDPISGQPPSLANVPTGCPFHPRCKFADAHCTSEKPGTSSLLGGLHTFACWRPQGD